MAKAKLGIGQMEINKKFESFEEAYKYAKNLKQFIYDVCKRKAHKGWMAQAMIVVSETKRNASRLKSINGKYELVYNDVIIDKVYKGEFKTDWHIHILVVSKPCDSFRKAIKNYVDRNWIKVENIYDYEDFDEEDFKKKVYRKYCNINMAKYFIEQSSARLFCNYNFGNDEDIKYSLNDYFKEYMKLEDKKRKAYRKYFKHGSEERLLRDLEKAKSKFKEIEDFYYSLTEKKDKEIVKEFLEFVDNREHNKKFGKREKWFDLQTILGNDIDEIDLFLGE